MKVPFTNMDMLLPQRLLNPLVTVPPKTIPAFFYFTDISIGKCNVIHCDTVAIGFTDHHNVHFMNYNPPA